MNLLGVLEGILFAVGDEGISLKTLIDVLGVSSDEVKNLLKDLQVEYEKTSRGIRISYLGDAF